MMFTQEAFDAWAMFCFWLSNLKYEFNIETHVVTFVPPFPLRYIEVKVSVPA